MASKPTATRASARTKTTASSIPAPTVTRTTRARTAAKPTTSTTDTTATTTKRTTTRKAPSPKEATPEVAKAPAKSKAAKATTTSSTSTPVASRRGAKAATRDTDREPIMAYLRIRPQLGDDDSASPPYLTSLSDTTVNMTNPQDPDDSRSKFRFSTVPPSSIYTFSHVFPPTTTQSDFFTKTTLPLVQDVLTGQNGLLFTYGVTNSGKTYTVQGGTQPGTAGILPRSLDVIFNSIEGLHGDGKYCPVRLHGIEASQDYDQTTPAMPETSLTEVLGPLDQMNDEPVDFATDPTTVKVDRNYEYTVWISYAEVYNEKVYDLLASVKNESSKGYDAPAGPRAGAPKSMVLTRQALPLRPSPTSDAPDSETSGKYIAGLRQFRVHSASQAKALVKLGQLHRRVFGTLANRESSRSHGMVIIKVVRGHRGTRGDPTALQVSRLTLVDLAGSERTKHTHTTGDRLKEAGNINKSLMVLGQCMEVMRSNQRKVAASLAHEEKNGRMDTRDVKRSLAVVPFRHSKLTEALMDYFTGDGRTVMIVNVNPYDTGYDENSHVMKFAALAREVYVKPAPAPVQRVLSLLGPGKTQGHKIKQLGPMTLRDPEIKPLPYSLNRRKVQISVGGFERGKQPLEATLEVQEEEEPMDEDEKVEDEDDDPVHPFIDSLFDEIQSLRFQLFEAEMRCATIEAEVRQEVMEEMEERMRAVERLHSKRLMKELEENEIKTDAKIDMLHQSGLFGSPVKKSQHRPMYEDISEEEDVEMSLVDYGNEDEDDHSMSPSPLAKKRAVNGRKSSVPPQPIIQKIPFKPDPPMLPSDIEDAEMTETDGQASMPPSAATASTLDDDHDEQEYSEAEEGEEEDDDDEEEDDEDDEDVFTEGEKEKYEDEDVEEEEEEEEDENEDEEEEDSWVPEPKHKTPRSKKMPSPSVSPSPPPKSRNTKPAPKSSRVSKLAQDMNKLVIKHDEDDEEESEEEAPVIKKKKRQLGKNKVVMEDELNKLTESPDPSSTRSGTLKRLTKR